MTVHVVLGADPAGVRVALQDMGQRGVHCSADSRVADLNDRLLAALALDWYTVSPLDRADVEVPGLDTFFSEALALAEARSREHPQWALADRALAKALPFWQRVLERAGLAHTYVICLSSPFEACRRYAQHGLSPEHGQLVWLEHYATALSLSAGRPRAVLADSSAAGSRGADACADVSADVLSDVLKLHAAALALACGNEHVGANALADELRDALRRFAPALRVLSNVPVRGLETAGAEIRARKESAELRRHLEAILGSRMWRATLPLRNAVNFLRWMCAWPATATGAPDDATVGYQAWIAGFDTPGAEQRAAVRADAAALAHRPLISILMSVAGDDLPCLGRALDSVQAQVYAEWELCVCAPAAYANSVDAVIAGRAAQDPRIRVVPAASGPSAARGEFIARMGGRDALSYDALYRIANEINQYPDAWLVYSDHDEIDAAGRRRNGCFKPNWNPALLLSHDYVGRIAAYRRELLERAGAVGGGASDHELALRCAELAGADAIRHVPRVLYHFGRRAPARPEAVAGDVAAHLQRRRIRAEVCASAHGMLRVDYALAEPVPKVSILVPTTGDPALLGPCLESVLGRSTYPDFEVLVLISEANRVRAVHAAVLAEAGRDPRVRVVTYPDQPFNYSWTNNWGERNAGGTLLCLLNDDVEVITPDWIERLASRVQLDGVAIAGAMLYYPDDTIQHAGVILGLNGVASHQFLGFPRGSAGYHGRAAAEQDLSCVTAGCMMVRRDVFRELGGFNEHLAVAFNDVEFCIRARQKGWRIVWTPTVELYHHESASVGSGGSATRLLQLAQERSIMRRAWGGLLDSDPFYNSNLSLETPYHMAAAPRTGGG